MKKIIAQLLIVCMVLLLCACGKNNSSAQEDEITGDTMGAVLYQDFADRVKKSPSSSVLELADGVLLNPVIEFMGQAVPVEEGYLNGFTEEIHGFRQGAMFGPVIGSMPFVGYIFVLDDKADVEAFKNLLTEKSDMRWNICTEADEKLVAAVGNKVFFIMCSNNSEE